MKRKADLIVQYNGVQNPFSDYISRNYTDTKIVHEFCPTGCFRSLFNENNEVLLGTRGSGKTYLLRAMRLSMLRKMTFQEAKQIVSECSFFSLYLPMHLEEVRAFDNPKWDSNCRIDAFQFFFNCALAVAIVQELKELLADDSSEDESILKSYKAAKQLDEIWFAYDNTFGKVSDLQRLEQKLNSMYYSIDFSIMNFDKTPPMFRRQIGATLFAAQTIITEILGTKNEPTWIICVDEAEWLGEIPQKCINEFFRSDSKHVVLKVATLPFHHIHDTLTPGIKVSVGNDFAYRFIDMAYDSAEFIALSNQLCKFRLNERLGPKSLDIDTLEDFLGKEGNDALIDYYRKAVGEEQGTRAQIETGIIKNLSHTRQEGLENCSEEKKRKIIFDKFSTIFYVREMYIKNQTGNNKPGWYAGAHMVRKISQGNPRLFLSIMNALYSKACETKLSPKAQHEVLLKFAEDYCDSLRGHDYNAYRYLNKIGEIIQKKVHDKKGMVEVGCSFILSDIPTNLLNLEWMKEAISLSRVIVDEKSLKYGLSEDTKYVLSYAYATKFWLPMRTDAPVRIKFSDLTETYAGEEKQDNLQISLWE